MPYRVKEPEVNVLLKVGEIVDTDGKHIAYDHVSQLFLLDEVVYEDATTAKEVGQTGPLSPDVVRLYDEGDVHTRAVLGKITEAKTKKTTKSDKVDSEE